ncbi:MAG: hypothetical protein JXA18_07200 [Chitinispirillaceae bacterium]|nr:hypothetical protein [Chitinispirillaceae bacterium]
MQKKIRHSLSLATGILVLVSCSNLDQYTGVGSEVVEEADPKLVNFEKNFFAYAADTLVVNECFSLPGTPTPRFGHHAGKLAAGSEEGIEVYGYTEFVLTYDFAAQFDTADVLDSIVFVYDTIGDTSLVRDNPVADSAGLKLVGCSEESKYAMLPEAATDAIGVLKPVSAEDRRYYTGRLVDSVLSDSIFDLCLAYNDCISRAGGNGNEKKAYCDTTIDRSIYIALFNTDDGLAWFKFTPAMVIHTHRIKKVNDTDTIITRTDSLRGISGIVARETDSLVSSLAPLPLSTWLSQRTAVFKLDLAPLWDTIASTGFDEILSAAAVFDGRHVTGDDIADTPIVFYFIADELITDGGILDDRIDTINKYYAPVVKLQPSDSDTIVLPVDYHLQHYGADKPRFVYLYLRITSNDVYGKQEIIWRKPRFKAVLTTLK